MKRKFNHKLIKSEKDLLSHLIAYLKKDGYNVKIEVPNMGQSADLVATKGRWVTFIEAKMNNWERALNQCIAHETVGDYIYIAIASVSVSNKLREKINHLGYGIIHCNPYSGKCSIELKAQCNSKIWFPQRTVFLEKMKEIEYAY